MTTRRSPARPEETLRVLDAHPGPIDLLITGVVMPGTSGYVLSEQVERRRPEIRILFMSGFVVVPAHYGSSGEDRGLEPGSAILAKPFTGSRLHEKVREVLGAPGPVRTPPREPALGAWPSNRPSPSRPTRDALIGATPIEGGIPLMAGGKIIGSFGVSGGTAPQDGQVAKAGVDALR